MKINIKKAMLTLLAVPMLAAGVAGLVAPHVGAAASDNGLGLKKGQQRQPIAALGSKKVLALHMEVTR